MGDEQNSNSTKLMKGYESCASMGEIAKIIERSSRKEGNFLWQNLRGNRQIFNIAQMELQEELGLLKVYTSIMHPAVDDEEPVYLKLSFRDTIFKVKVTNMMNNVLFLEFPREVVAKEYRTTARIKFRPKDGKKARVGLKTEIVGETFQSMLFPLIDISDSGLGIVVSDDNLELIKNSKGLRLEAIGKVELTFEFMMDMVYAHRLRYRHKGLIRKGNRVGIKFRENLDRAVLEALTSSFE